MTTQRKKTMRQLATHFRKSTSELWTQAGFSKENRPKSHVCLTCLEELGEGLNQPYETAYKCPHCGHDGIWGCGTYHMDLEEALCRHYPEQMGKKTCNQYAPRRYGKLVTLH